MRVFRSPVGPKDVIRTGDDRPARSLLRYVWRMSGWHQVTICLLAAAVAGLSMVPLELQRRTVNDAIGEGDLRLLAWLGAIYAAVLLLQSCLKFILKLYQAWLSESAVLYTRGHLTSINADRIADASDQADGQAVSVITSEIDKLGGFVGEGISQPVVNLGIVCAIFGYFIVTEPMIAALSLPFLLPQILTVTWVQRTINRLVQARVSMLRNASDTLTRHGERSRDPYVASAALRFRRLFDNRTRTVVLKFAAKGLANLLNGLAPLAALLIGGYLVIQGETSLGVVLAFVSGFDRVSNPLRELIAYYRVAAQANVQHQMIARWM